MDGTHGAKVNLKKAKPLSVTSTERPLTIFMELTHE